ncbi:hypothetical protein [Novosphingobium lindaniclasticum]|jgi:uncharacterized membrane protein|uniref:hypothetical protein n=1 Tax=Novosphingobium lindaniclasticum TaxID=1329895 RepID=UPI0024097171|nr:hypothetical protein [Novosphingobium lindaniclasticum]
MLAVFVLLRVLDVYGDSPWSIVESSAMPTAVSFFALTKYPASLLFLMLTLGCGALLLVMFECPRDSRMVDRLALSAPRRCSFTSSTSRFQGCSTMPPLRSGGTPEEAFWK